MSSTPKTVVSGFKERLAAMGIDSLIMWVLLNFLGNLLSGNPSNTFIGIVISLPGLIVTFIAGWLYFAIQESSLFQGTLGKRALKISITDEAGQRITFIKASMRYLFKWLSVCILFLGFFMMLWDKDHRTLHDKLSGTRGVKTLE